MLEDSGSRLEPDPEYLIEDTGRQIMVRGEIRDEHGNVCTEARCIFVRLSNEIMTSSSASEANYAGQGDGHS